MSLLLAAAAAASAHGREENPRLAEHAEGRGRRRPSSGVPRARRPPRLVSAARSAQAVSRAERGPAPRLYSSATAARAASSWPGSPAAFAPGRCFVPQPGGPAPRAPEPRKAAARPRAAPPPAAVAADTARSRFAPPFPVGDREGARSRRRPRPASSPPASGPLPPVATPARPGVPSRCHALSPH